MVSGLGKQGNAAHPSHHPGNETPIAYLHVFQVAMVKGDNRLDTEMVNVLWLLMCQTHRVNGWPEPSRAAVYQAPVKSMYQFRQVCFRFISSARTVPCLHITLVTSCILGMES